MKFSQSNHEITIPDSQEIGTALSRTTHLGIGAHQDDLEFMALHGILECFEQSEKWFGGITCTDGSGSARTGPYAKFSNEEMKAVRVEEQKTAATIGQYSFIAQIGHPSNNAKDFTERSTLVDDIKTILVSAKPDVVYTHNPFDKHATHIGVLLATLSAIHELPLDDRPKQLFGCEVWRGLDWLPDDEKIIHDVSAHPDLATSLAGVFASQIAGGKRYDLAVEGRRLANATFFDSHSIDASDRVQYAIDLSSLISGQNSLRNLMTEKLTIFHDEIFELLDDVSG